MLFEYPMHHQTSPHHNPQSGPVPRSAPALQSRGSRARRRDHRQDHVASGRPGRPHCWTKSPPNSRSGTSEIRKRLSGTLRTGPRVCYRRDEDLSEPETAADRLLFPGRILAGIRGAVQSFHRAASRPDGSAARRAAIRSQPARHRGRTHLLHHVSHRHHPSPISGSRSCPPRAFSPSRARSRTPCTRRRCSSENSPNWA